MAGITRREVREIVRKQVLDGSRDVFIDSVSAAMRRYASRLGLSEQENFEVERIGHRQNSIAGLWARRARMEPAEFSAGLKKIIEETQRHAEALKAASQGIKGSRQAKLDEAIRDSKTALEGLGREAGGSDEIEQHPPAANALNANEKLLVHILGIGKYRRRDRAMDKVAGEIGRVLKTNGG